MIHFFLSRSYSNAENKVFNVLNNTKNDRDLCYFFKEQDKDDFGVSFIHHHQLLFSSYTDETYPSSLFIGFAEQRRYHWSCLLIKEPRLLYKLTLNSPHHLFTLIIHGFLPSLSSPREITHAN